MTQRTAILMVVTLGLGLFAAALAEGPRPEYLYLLSGTAANGAPLPVTLYRVPAAEPGEAEAVRKVADGMDCALSDPERRRLVVASPPLAPTDFQVIDMDAPSRAISLRIPYNSDEQLPVGVYLLDLPARGEVVALELTQNWKPEKPIPYHLVGVALGTAGAAPFDLSLDDLGYIRTSGLVGGALPLPQNWVWMRGDPLRTVSAGAGRGPGIQLPPYLKGAGNRDYLLAANNDSATVLQGPPGTLDVLSKKSNEWHRVPIPFSASRVRAFGPWLAAIQSTPRSAASSSSVVEIRPSTAGAWEASPGSAKRRTEEIGGKMTVDGLFQQSMDVFSGELLIYDTRSGATFRVSTGEGDSEILLVTDSAVYYRVNDELFRAALSGGGPGKAVMIASGPAIIQAHWAFLSDDAPPGGR